jgi:hypothetical protein
MSVTSTTATQTTTYVNTATPVSISFPFNYTNGIPDLLVNDGAITLGYNSDYTISGGSYNASNQLQTGTLTWTGTGSHTPTAGDLITIQRSIPFTQTTTFSSTGILTPLMIEQDDDRLTTIAQQINNTQYNPFPVLTGGPQIVMVPWVTVETGTPANTGTPTSLNSLNVSQITSNYWNQLVICTTITYPGAGNSIQFWKLIVNTSGYISSPGIYVLPLYQASTQNLIWVRVA